MKTPLCHSVYTAAELKLAVLQIRAPIVQVNLQLAARVLIPLQYETKYLSLSCLSWDGFISFWDSVRCRQNPKSFVSCSFPGSKPAASPGRWCSPAATPTRETTSSCRGKRVLFHFISVASCSHFWLMEEKKWTYLLGLLWGTWPRRLCWRWAQTLWRSSAGGRWSECQPFPECRTPMQNQNSASQAEASPKAFTQTGKRMLNKKS